MWAGVAPCGPKDSCMSSDAIIEIDSDNQVTAEEIEPAFDRIWERCSGVNRGQREHKGSFRGHQKEGVVRCSLDSCLLLSSFFA